MNAFSDDYDLGGEGRQTRQMAASAEIQQLTRDVQQLETGHNVNFIKLSFSSQGLMSYSARPGIMRGE